MKSFKILIAAVAVTAVLFSGCKKEPVFTGVDSTKAGVTDFTYDETMSSPTSISLVWNPQKALDAGATSISVQLARQEDFSDASMYDPTISMYDAPKGITIQKDDKVVDGAIFTGLKEYDRFYARIRANYPRSIYSEWTVLNDGDAIACVSVGHGLIAMSFTAPKTMKLEAPAYSKINVSWSLVGSAEAYVVEWKKSSDSKWNVLGQVTAAQAQITDLEPTTSYDVRVKAVRGSESTDYISDSVTTPEKPAFQPNIDDKDAFLQFVSGIAATSGASDVITLEKDLDLGGAEIPVSEAFAGQFDGKGHTIKNAVVPEHLFKELSGSFKNVTLSGFKLSNSLIDNATASAVIKGVVLDASCTVDFPQPEDAANFGGIVGTNLGSVEDCSTAAKIDLKFAALPKATEIWGGIAGYTEGVVKNCHNTGSLSISVDAPASGAYHWIGGVVGQFKGEAGKAMVIDCTNKGDVSVEFVTAAYFHTGGVAGGTPSEAECPNDFGAMEGCVNEAKVSMHYINGGSGAYPNIGGVVGYAEGSLKSCSNKGVVSLSCDHVNGSSATWTDIHQGGVGGTVTRGASDCHNSGALAFTGNYIAGGTDKARSSGCIQTCCFGGVIGAAGPYNSGDNILFEKCTNSADLDLTVGSATETPNHHAGAVFGFVKAKIADCENTGNFTFTSPVAINRLGGIAGGCTFEVSGCTNKGNLKVVHAAITKTDWRAFIGGIVGDSSKSSAALTYSKCNNSGNLEFVSTASVSTSKTSCIGGIIGGGKSGVEYTFNECSNTGKLSYSSPGTCVTGDLRAGDYN